MQVTTNPQKTNNLSSRPRDVLETIAVHKSTDYEQFAIISGNREVDDRHVMRLVHSITQHNLLKYNPIMVNEDYKVIDGQHRLLAAKALSLPVYYVVVEGAALEEVRLLNSNNRAWTIYDYLESYIQIGSKKHIELKQFMQDYHLTIEAALVLLYGGADHSTYEKLRNGSLDFTAEQMDKARTRADIVEDIRPFFKGTTGRRALLFRAIMAIEAKDLGRELINKLQVSNQMLQPQPDRRSYMRMLEDVLNYNRKVDLIRLF